MPELKIVTKTNLGFRNSFSGIYGHELISPTIQTYKIFTEKEFKKIISGGGQVQIPVSKISSYFIKGDQVQILKLDSGAREKFEIKDEVFITLFTSEDMNENDKSPRQSDDLFRVLLTEKVVETNIDELDGIAYRGTVPAFKANPISSKFLDVLPTDPDLIFILEAHRKVLSSKFSKTQFIFEKASKAKVGSFDVFYIEGNYIRDNIANSEMRAGGIVIKAGTNNYTALEEHWGFGDSSSPQKPKVGDWFLDSDFAIFFDTQTMHQCPHIFIFKDGKAQQTDVNCKTGGC